MNSTEKLELQVSEDQDGSALVELPGDEPSPQADDATDDTQNLAKGGAAKADSSDDGEPDDSADDVDGDTDAEREAIRAARREERRLKRSIHREKAKESNHLINTLKMQNSQLAERLALLEKRTSGAELARVDKAIDDAAVQVEYAKMKMREAVVAQDGDGVVKAQEMLFNSQRQLEALNSTKEQAVKHMSQPQKQNIQQVDPSVQRMASEWMARNTWYDPQAKDEESEIAQSIDKRLTAEGYNPASEEYWEELDDRLTKYLPHRMSARASAGSSPRPRPRSPVTGSGRESAPAGRSANEFRVSPERVAAMKEMGAWDDPEARARMIKSYAAYDRANKGR